MAILYILLVIIHKHGDAARGLVLNTQRRILEIYGVMDAVAPRTSLWSRLVVFYSFNKPNQLNVKVREHENIMVVKTRRIF